ncbi:hypothetical protein [Clostridium botulinum]|uniref:hypothetical protein n=1 Tax=Clostridium botulinum TaxID=1491 RepID=UPI00174A2813|nr:hypothetical protein [Clostridium botulinum]MBD5589345.1 hypothetical protein [Clostridium botulinum]
MGYDIVSGRSKKEMDEDYNNVLSHIQCQYAYEEHFRKAFGCEISDWNGRLYKKDRENFIAGIDNFINILENTQKEIPMYRGYISNCSPKNLIEQMKDLRKLIQEGKIGYMRIS